MARTRSAMKMKAPRRTPTTVSGPGSAGLARLATELKQVNEALWQIEDEIRLRDRNEDFGPRFIALARSVYATNDRRAALKRQINELLGSKLIEEKSYASY